MHHGWEVLVSISVIASERRKKKEEEEEEEEKTKKLTWDRCLFRPCAG